MSAALLAAYGLEPSVPTTVAAPALGVTPKTIIHWIEAGTIPGGKVGDRWLVPLSALQRLQQDMKAMKWGPPATPGAERSAPDRVSKATAAADRLARALGKTGARDVGRLRAPAGLETAGERT